MEGVEGERGNVLDTIAGGQSGKSVVGRIVYSDRRALGLAVDRYGRWDLGVVVDRRRADGYLFGCIG